MCVVAFRVMMASPLSRYPWGHILLAMSGTPDHLHARDIAGVTSSYRYEWNGVDLRGLYLIENTLSKDTDTEPATRPIVLFSGYPDPRMGSYSAGQIEMLLRDGGAAAVVEAHFSFEGQDGYAEPEAIVEDVIAILGETENPPVVVAQSLSTLFTMAALHRLPRDSAANRKPKVLLIAPSLSPYQSLYGKVSKLGMLYLGTGPDSQNVRHAGHPFSAGNIARSADWNRDTEFWKRFVEEDGRAFWNGPPRAEVETAYFFFDFSSGEGRRHLHRALDVRKQWPYLSGLHRSLRNHPQADALLLSFFRKACAVP